MGLWTFKSLKNVLSASVNILGVLEKFCEKQGKKYEVFIGPNHNALPWSLVSKLNPTILKGMLLEPWEPLGLWESLGLTLS